MNRLNAAQFALEIVKLLWLAVLRGGNQMIFLEFLPTGFAKSLIFQLLRTLNVLGACLQVGGHKHKSGGMGTTLGACGQVGGHVHKSGDMCTSRGACAQVWGHVHKFGGMCTSWGHVHCNNVMPLV